MLRITSDTLTQDGGSKALAAMRPRKIRVLLADDHPIVRGGLAQLLREQSDMEVVGEAKDGQEAVELTLQLRPDVIVMDVMMPRLNGIEATRRVKAALPYISVIGHSTCEDEGIARAMREAGASAFVEKCRADDTLVATIRTQVAPQIAA